jgi:ABC-2 type transport system ATP-binding protein
VRAAERESAIATLAGVTGETPVADATGSRIRVPARDGSQTLLTAVRALDAAGLTTDDIALHRPTLDDVFLALTGDRAGTREPAATATRRSRRNPR